MRLIDIFSYIRTNDKWDDCKNIVLYKKYTEDSNCTVTLAFDYNGHRYVYSTLPFPSYLVLADNNDMLATYVRTPNGYLYDRIQFTPSYTDLVLFSPRDNEGIGKQVEGEDIPKEDQFIFDNKDKNIDMIVRIKTNDIRALEIGVLLT